MKNIAAIILAAGKGTRIQAPINRNKVTYRLNGKAMIAHTVDLFNDLGFDEIIVVVGFASESVKEVLGNQVKYAFQATQQGTADAVKAGLQSVSQHIDTIVSVYGDDSAFYNPKLITALLETHQKHQADVTFVTIIADDPTGLGRIIRNPQGEVEAIVEEKNATPGQKQINEINTGLYCFKKAFLTKIIHQVRKNPVSQEYYLTDIIELARENHKKITTVTWPDSSVWFGINTRQQLYQARQLKQQP